MNVQRILVIFITEIQQNVLENIILVTPKKHREQNCFVIPATISKKKRLMLSRGNKKSLVNWMFQFVINSNEFMRH